MGNYDRNTCSVERKLECRKEIKFKIHVCGKYVNEIKKEIWDKDGHEILILKTRRAKKNDLPFKKKKKNHPRKENENHPKKENEIHRKR